MRLCLFLWLSIALVGPTWAQPVRKVQLRSTHNTRELGGIPLALVPPRGGVSAGGGGRAWVRHGKVYRSGDLCHLTASDVTRMQGLHIRTILDFRSQHEVKLEGLDRAALRRSVPNNVSLALRNELGIGRAAYRAILRENDATLLRLFQILARPDSYPVLYHCTAGKDRTGVVTALLLDLLGADRSQIMDDYLQSQRNSVQLIVRRSWLEEAFKVIDKAGGTEKYLRKLGLTAAEVESIRSILIQRP